MFFNFCNFGSKEFGIPLLDARVLDFGCGSGAFALSLLRQGAKDIVGVDVDTELLDIAISRLNDFEFSGCHFREIDFVDETSGLPFEDGEFDIVGARVSTPKEVCAEGIVAGAEKGRASHCGRYSKQTLDQGVSHFKVVLRELPSIKPRRGSRSSFFGKSGLE